MAFALKPEESLRKSVRRIARKEMDYAQTQVTMTANGTRDAAVHEVRKSGKKLRARICRKVDSNSLLPTIGGIFRAHAFQYMVWHTNFATDPNFDG
jgi:hypothetical protein